MAHLILVFYSPNGSVSTESIPSHLERVLYAMDTTEIPFEGPVRTGYNKPVLGTMEIQIPRVKKECIPIILKKLNATVLNPKNNKMTIKRIKEKAQPNCNLITTIGKTPRFIIYLFKWFYRLKLNKYLPIMPVEVSEEKVDPYVNPKIYWNNCWCLGYLPDPEVDPYYNKEEDKTYKNEWL